MNAFYYNINSELLFIQFFCFTKVTENNGKDRGRFKWSAAKAQKVGAIIAVD